ncbi:MAG: hypothetical protein C0412_00040 [Flavobacterium sp.]|nr:hypothetical protein [Flavobacterium sp.]
MPRETEVILKNISSDPLISHYSIGQYDFPFTLNPTVGCFFSCKYCYSPIFVAKVKNQKRKQFFETVRVKMNVANKLNVQLTKLADIPQHLKRVQINETSDYYLPKVLNELESNDRDIMKEILQVFQHHASLGNVWMLHILTKSNKALKHLTIFEEMKDMVQIEISISTHDESVRRKIEFYTIPIKKRLELIEALAQKDIFVRVMAMPFYGNKTDVREIKRISFNYGARAFKNKSLNYFDWQELVNLSYDELINDRITRKGIRQDIMYEDLNKRSGEVLFFDGKPKTKNLLMPIPKTGKRKPPDWAIRDFGSRLIETNLEVINCGYSTINRLDWGYIF